MCGVAILSVSVVAGKDSEALNKSFSALSLSNLLLWAAYLYYALLSNIGKFPSNVTQSVCHLFQKIF